jgi:hypothetical protein
MKNTKSKLAALLLWAIGFSTGYAQQAILASGGDASGNGGSVTYSLGQIVYTSNTGPKGSVNQGIQEAYEIITLGINETALNISLYVFPNPVKDKLTLLIENFSKEKLVYQLFDIHGQLVDSEQISGNQTQINTGYLSGAIYFLNIVEGTKQIQSFKIIKN